MNWRVEGARRLAFWRWTIVDCFWMSFYSVQFADFNMIVLIPSIDFSWYLLIERVHVSMCDDQGPTSGVWLTAFLIGSSSAHLLFTSLNSLHTPSTTAPLCFQASTSIIPFTLPVSRNSEFSLIVPITLWFSHGGLIQFVVARGV